MKKSNKYTLPAVLISGVILLTGVAVVTGGVKAGGSDVSFWDKVAQYTAQIIGSKVEVPALEDLTFGAVPGTLHTQPEFFQAGFAGAVIATSTTATADTLLERDLAKFTVFQVTPNTGSLTYTLPATTTLSTLLRSAGDTKQWLFKNATSTTATNLTIAAAAGWDLAGITGANAIAGAAAGNEVWMEMTCTRQTNKDIVCLFTENVAL